MSDWNLKGLKKIPFSKRKDKLFDWDTIRLSKKVAMDKQNLELEKLRLEIDDIRRKRYFYLIIDKLLIAGLIAIIGIFGNVWIEKLHSSTEEELEKLKISATKQLESFRKNTSFEVEEIKHKHDKEIKRIEDKYQRESEREAKQFQDQLQRQYLAIQQSFKQYSQEQAQKFTENMEWQKQAFNSYNAMSQQEDAKKRQIIDAELDARLKAFEESTKRMNWVIEKRLPVYSQLSVISADIISACNTKSTNKKLFKDLSLRLEKYLSEHILIISDPTYSAFKTIHKKLHQSGLITDTMTEIKGNCHIALNIMKEELLFKSNDEAELKANNSNPADAKSRAAD